MSVACHEQGDILGCRSDALSIVVIQARRRLRQEAVVFFAQLAFLPQRFFPTLFQRSHHEAILGFDALILTLRALHLILGAFQALTPMLMKSFALLFDVRCCLQA